MAKNVKPVPDGYHTVTPYLVQKDTNKALDYYQKAFGAEVIMSMPGAGGKIMHAEMKIGDSFVFMSDEFPEWSPDTKSPQTVGAVTGTVFLYVTDVDAVYKRAVDAGARSIMPPSDMFWGDRFGKVADQFGHHWGIATHIEDVPPGEIGKRQAEWMKQMAQNK